MTKSVLKKCCTEERSFSKEIGTAVDGQCSANLQVDHTPVYDEISDAEAYHTRSPAKTSGVAETQEAKVRHSEAQMDRRRLKARLVYFRVFSHALSSTHPADQNDCTRSHHVSEVPSTKIVR